MTVYKAVIVQKLGTSILDKETYYEFNKKGEQVKKTRKLESPIEVPRYSVLGIKFVNPAKEYFKYKQGFRGQIRHLPIDFTYEAYNHKEKHVLFVDYDSGSALKMGGGEVEYSFPPQEDATRSSLMRSVGDLMRGQMNLIMILLALGFGVFLGMFIQNTLIPMASG